MADNIEITRADRERAAKHYWPVYGPPEPVASWIEDGGKLAAAYDCVAALAREFAAVRAEGREGCGEREVVGYRIRVIGSAGVLGYAFADDTPGENGWNPTDYGDPKPAPIARAEAGELLRRCRAWGAEYDAVPFAWTYRLVRVVRRRKGGR